MSRYRPPASKSSPYITPRGHRDLSDELRYLWKEKRPEVTLKVAEAAALGDRSENAEYIYGKRQLGEIDRRIRHLAKRLDDLTVVDRPPRDTSKVFFGAWVSVETDAGETRRYRLVGPDEFDREKAFISVDSPLARVVLGKRVDDEVHLTVHGEESTLCIVDITYET
ncbi:MAG: transcription elongation factor GreB [Gammaproteobacteria bacterium]|nr:transcription elongation factor GreB [Gammaproteobacteria bacterium]